MKSIPCSILLLVALPALSSASCRRTHRSLLPEDYLEDYASSFEEPSYVERIPKRLSCYSRRAPQLARSYYESPPSYGYPTIYEAPAYSYPSPPAPAVVSKGLGGTICGPLGTTIRGQIGCGGLSGSVVTPIGASISGSIGNTLHSAVPEPCRPCGHHRDYSSVHYLKVKQDAETKLTEKRFSAALDIVAYLKENHHEVGIFRYPGREGVRKQILRMLQRGDRLALGAMLRPGVEMESSAAFCSFLQNLKDPLIPCRVQELISADNQVPDDVVAIDALGLIYQELSGIHLTLVIQTLELFRLINQNSSRNELASISLAVVLLPILMDIKVLQNSLWFQQTWTKRWKDVALILHEMILQSDSWKPVKDNINRRGKGKQKIKESLLKIIDKKHHICKLNCINK